MVRQAATLNSLDGFNLSTEALYYLAEKLAYISAHDCNKTIWFVRNLAYIHAEYPELIERGWKAKYELELINAFDKADFIRHDIDSNSFRIGVLYHAIYPEADNTAEMPCCLDDLCRTSFKSSNGSLHWVGNYHHTGNENYESFKNPTGEQIKIIKAAMESCLSDMEYVVLAYRYGLKDGKIHSIRGTSSHLRVSVEYVTKTEKDALKKLRGENILKDPE